MRTRRTETVYLLHFAEPIGNPGCRRGQAQHHVGVTANLDSRTLEHARGEAARITAYLQSQGIAFDVVRTWTGGRDLERRLKRQKKARMLCPICSGRAAMNRMKNNSRDLVHIADGFISDASTPDQAPSLKHAA